MSKQGTLLVKWVRSGIGFPRKQKEMVRSLGLRRLNQVVERPDNPQTRGLVASIPHLVAIVEGNSPPAWARAAEYTIGVPPSASKPPSEKAEDQTQIASSGSATSAGAEGGAPSDGAEPSEGRESSEESGASAGKRPRRKRGEEKKEE